MCNNSQPMDSIHGFAVRSIFGESRMGQEIKTKSGKVGSDVHNICEL